MIGNLGPGSRTIPSGLVALVGLKFLVATSDPFWDCSTTPSHLCEYVEIPLWPGYRTWCLSQHLIVLLINVENQEGRYIFQKTWGFHTSPGGQATNGTSVRLQGLLEHRHAINAWASCSFESGRAFSGWASRCLNTAADLKNTTSAWHVLFCTRAFVEPLTPRGPCRCQHPSGKLQGNDKML